MGNEFSVEQSALDKGQAKIPEVEGSSPSMHNPFYYDVDENFRDILPDLRRRRKKEEVGKRYRSQSHESKGCYVDCYPGPAFDAPIMPSKWDSASLDHRHRVRGFVEQCIAKFNEHHFFEPNYKFQGIKHVTSTGIGAKMYYLTFTACQVDAPHVCQTFQARYHSVFGGILAIVECKIKAKES